MILKGSKKNTVSFLSRGQMYLFPNTLKPPDRTACQILKAWLNRRYKNQNKEEFLIMDRLDPQRPSAAYQAGRLIAEYAAIQTDALGDVNAGIVERYYTSACASPAPVIGKLSTMSQYHLSKLKGEKKWLYDIHSQALEEISCKIGEALPKRFSLEQQLEFALGYYCSPN
ncbi:MAG: type I-C CRISPR-associated protein Cas8c/Csd1 [Oscillospiraceae bacterium]